MIIDGVEEVTYTYRDRKTQRLVQRKFSVDNNHLRGEVNAAQDDCGRYYQFTVTEREADDGSPT